MHIGVLSLHVVRHSDVLAVVGVARINIGSGCVLASSR